MTTPAQLGDKTRRLVLARDARELADLLDATCGGGLADPPRIALVDALSPGPSSR